MRAWHAVPGTDAPALLRREVLIPPRPRTAAPGGCYEDEDPAAAVIRKAGALRFVMLEKEAERDCLRRELRSRCEVLRHYPWRPPVSGRLRSAPPRRGVHADSPVPIRAVNYPPPAGTTVHARKKRIRPPAASSSGGSLVTCFDFTTPAEAKPPPAYDVECVERTLGHSRVGHAAAAAPALQTALYRSLGASRGCDAWVTAADDAESPTALFRTRKVEVERKPLPGHGAEIESARHSVRTLLKQAKLELRVLERMEMRDAS